MTPREIGIMLRREYPCLEWDVVQYHSAAQYVTHWRDKTNRCYWNGASRFELHLFPRGAGRGRTIKMRMKQNARGYIRYWSPRKRMSTTDWGPLENLVERIRQIINDYDGGRRG